MGLHIADLDRERQLASMGLTGVALRVGAAITDPVGIAVGALTAGISNAARLSRFQRIIRSALAAGATGQPSDMVFGNPTTSLMNEIIAASGGLADATRDGRSPSQAEMRNLQRVLPFQNFLPFAQLYAAMISDLPERAPRD